LVAAIIGLSPKANTPPTSCLNGADLDRIYPALVHHSVMSFGSEQVLRFLQRRDAQEVKTDRRRGPDGVRVKHWLNDNSLKLADLAGGACFGSLKYASG
jgi:hypothetical protein